MPPPKTVSSSRRHEPTELRVTSHDVVGSKAVRSPRSPSALQLGGGAAGGSGAAGGGGDTGGDGDGVRGGGGGDGNCTTSPLVTTTRRGRA